MAIDIPTIDTSPDVACGSISRTHWTFRPRVQDRPFFSGEITNNNHEIHISYIYIYIYIYMCVCV